MLDNTVNRNYLQVLFVLDALGNLLVEILFLLKILVIEGRNGRLLKEQNCRIMYEWKDGLEMRSFGAVRSIVGGIMRS